MTAGPFTGEQVGSRLSALHFLCNLGWHFLTRQDCLRLRGGTREVLIKPRLIEVLQTRRFDYKGESYPLSPSAIDQVLRAVSAVSLAEGLAIANERLYTTLTLGITVTEFMPDGKRHEPTIAVIDWQDVSANRWEVTEQADVLAAQGTQTRTSDLICYVNGIPLAVIACIQPGARGTGQDATVQEGISRQLRHQRAGEIPHLFAYAQLLLAVSEDEGRYGTTLTQAGFWARWREEEFSEAQLRQWKNRSLPAATQTALFAGKSASVQQACAQQWSRPMVTTEQDRLLAALLQPARMLELLRLFILFDVRGKVVARYQQFFGTRALIARISQRRPDGGREGGVVWHTTGSGKSLTMVFLTKALVLVDKLKACRVLVVSDRLDLEGQLARNFIHSGAFGSAMATRKEGEKPKVGSGRELARRIGQGSERLMLTLIQKLATASQLPECYNPSADLIVLVDEGHRSHGGQTHERMRKMLPRAAYVAFTGTPLLKEEKAANTFGPIVHAYTMQRAVEDGTVLPLLYEERVPELEINDEAVNRWFDKITTGLSPAQSADLKKKFAGKRAIHGAANRIELIAWDIAAHFSEHINKLHPGLKGQVATASKLDAIRYKQYLDDTDLVSSAIIMSAPENREGNGGLDESTLPEVQTWWNAHVGQQQEEFERRVLDGFASDGAPDLLIVVDRLLTGFDEARNAVLYIDKPLKEHSLMQAIARVNRLHDDKRYGMLVDYRGILGELDTAVRAYQNLETRTQGAYATADIEGLYRQFSSQYKRLPELHAALWALFPGVIKRSDHEQFRQMLMPRYAEDEQGQSIDLRQKVREDFYDVLTQFGQCLQTALSSRRFFEDNSFSEDKVHEYKQDLRFFSELRGGAQRDARETVDYHVYEDQIRRLVDEQVIGLEVRQPRGVYLVHKLGEEVPEQWPVEKTRNESDLIRSRLKKTIELELTDDPYAQKVFAELLRHAIAEAEAMFAHPLKQYARLKSFEEQVARRELDGLPEGLGENRHARAYFGIFRLVLGEADFAAMPPDQLVSESLEIDKIVRQAVAENSLNPQNIEAVIRNALLLRLFVLIGLDRAKEVSDHVVHVARVGRERGPR